MPFLDKLKRAHVCGGSAFANLLSFLAEFITIGIHMPLISSVIIFGVRSLIFLDLEMHLRIRREERTSTLR